VLHADNILLPNLGTNALSNVYKNTAESLPLRYNKRLLSATLSLLEDVNGGKKTVTEIDFNDWVAGLEL